MSCERVHGEEAGREFHPLSPTLVSPVPREEVRRHSHVAGTFSLTPLPGAVSKVPELLTYRENHCWCVCVCLPP